MEEKIWYELVQVKFGETYLAQYISLQQYLRRTFKILTLVLSSSGALGWAIWKPIAGIACGIIAVMQVLSMIENLLFRTEEEIQKVCDLRTMYIKYLNKIEQLWVAYSNGDLSESDASKAFFKLRNKEWVQIEQLDNTLNIKHYKKLEEKADRLTNQYITTYHSTNGKAVTKPEIVC
ncbi:hypothetical protein [uncultured Pontibacter sp.]|uniref:hypothetical protein n=1 Tax=uncultured Pontibacter sp. TaxID=453356 RepID=UPI00260EC64D|nr:hypothetical protein [uncultured Pontibacter sp.]